MRVRLAQGGEHGVVQGARRAEGLGEVEERHCPVLPHALVALLGPDPGGQVPRHQGHDEVRAEHQAVLELADREGEDRRYEQVVPGERAHDPRREHGAAPHAQA